MFLWVVRGVDDEGEGGEEEMDQLWRVWLVDVCLQLMYNVSVFFKFS